VRGPPWAIRPKGYRPSPTTIMHGPNTAAANASEILPLSPLLYLIPNGTGLAGLPGFLCRCDAVRLPTSHGLQLAALGVDGQRTIGAVAAVGCWLARRVDWLPLRRPGWPCGLPELGAGTSREAPR